MVVKSDGTKWACQSCLKGHRVSGCNHTDRELTLVPKKGRPVTQCQHCRQERKKRSAHVSCDCGEVEKPHHSKEKCIHLREAEERAKAGLQEDHPVQSEERDTAHLATVAEEQGCCCHHGGKCSCAMMKKEAKKEDSTGTPPHGPAVKPRLETTKSEGSITKFENGHHKPVHRRNHLAHESGMPYKVPMPRAHTDENVKAKARRSADGLGLSKNKSFDPSALATGQNGSFSGGRRLSKSEQPSPNFNATDSIFASFGPPRLSPVDISRFDRIPAQQHSASKSREQANVLPLEPLSGIADQAFDPWSNMPSGDGSLMPTDNYFGAWPTGTDNVGLSQPALTAASSGTQSEIDEISGVDDMYGFGMPSIQEDMSSTNFLGASGADSPQSNRRSLPPDFLSVLPGTGSEWQPNESGFAASTAQTERKEAPGSQIMNFDNNMWQMPPLLPATELPYRQANFQSTMSQPFSQGFNAASRSGPDPFEELFPGMDCSGTGYSSLNNSQDLDSFSKSVPSNATSAPINFPPSNANGFNSQPWTDGPMSVPNNPFASPYNMSGQGFDGANFDGDWSQ
ncbi:hypothetical protein KC363_g3224 [Hortaea werneckii]|uniref:Copper-fist domain-containing protein n=1 Tax=Hortaea werneckii TaxID=91943 RepID=A0A3M7FWP8_HORWE|nr:hypothetical protein KC325_g1131 [Hortaea werneckii]KAI7001640.1 hypothetical protein KC359_g469 [Hortaea werneckii]KAI7150047.1 hypothetical protein KC344_g455 [Hortaea werneckii]KAI7177007.1 hypothetical protein KC360_g2655 [Hortaea werneckii]KAI7192519.1 hypothetical protein KC363_g3224 [Hortaea werneckii]